MPLAMMLGRRMPRDTVDGLFLVGYSWLGIFAFLLTLLLGAELAEYCLTYRARKQQALDALDDTLEGDSPCG